MNTPNKLTLLRIVLVPLMVAAFYIPWKYAYVAAAIIFIAGAITDTLDGNIARKRGLITTFGKFMDPIADKILVGAALIMLTSIGTVSPIVTLIVVGREFVVSGVRLLMAEKGVVLAADVWGKAKTVTQTIAIPLVMLYNPVFCLIDVPVDQIFLWISTVLCVVSGVRYVRGAWPYIFESR